MSKLAYTSSILTALLVVGIFFLLLRVRDTEAEFNDSVMSTPAQIFDESQQYQTPSLKDIKSDRKIKLSSPVKTT